MKIRSVISETGHVDDVDRLGDGCDGLLACGMGLRKAKAPVLIGFELWKRTAGALLVAFG